MKNILLIFGVVSIAVATISCNQSPKESASEKKTETKKTAKSEDVELNVELYCKISNAEKALLMDKYWEKFKGKSYEEAKADFDQYQKEEDAIYEKHGIEDKLKISNFFRGHFREIAEFQKNDPDFKEYPEYADAKNKLISFAMSNVSE